jgi:predicted amidohydrolase YtcJ
MKLLRPFAITLLLSGCASAPAPELVLVNGKVFTSDAANPWAQALAVRGNRIAAVGSSDEIRALARPATRVIDLNGRVVVPGFNDAHYHTGIGPPGLRLELVGMDPSFADVEQALARAAAAAPPDHWITGTIGPAVLDDPRANRDTLDRFSSRTPIMLTTWSGHGTILNTPALRILGIRDDERDPAGGFYLRDSNRRITGVLHEYADYIARRRYAALADRETAIRTIREDAAAAIRLGITSIQEMGTVMSAGPWADRIAEANVPVRWRLIRFPMTNAADWFAAEESDRSTPRLRVSGIKWIIDGTPVEGLAHMRAPYKDRPGSQGALNFSEPDLRRMLTESAREQVMLHVVGDRALDAVLSALDATGGGSFWRDKRVRIEHGDFLAPDQWERARNLGLIVVQNPSHFMIPEVMNARYTADVSARAQAVRSTLRAGIPLAFGSDGPVSPFLNLMFATIHANNPGEALSREEAVTAYTHGSAYAEFAEHEKGMLRSGMLADFAVLSADIFTVPPPQLPAVESVLTVIDGKVVYEAVR